MNTEPFNSGLQPRRRHLSQDTQTRSFVSGDEPRRPGPEETGPDGETVEGMCAEGPEPADHGAERAAASGASLAGMAIGTPCSAPMRRPSARRRR